MSSEQSGKISFNESMTWGKIIFGKQDKTMILPYARRIYWAKLCVYSNIQITSGALLKGNISYFIVVVVSFLGNVLFYWKKKNPHKHRVLQIRLFTLVSHQIQFFVMPMFLLSDSFIELFSLQIDILESEFNYLQACKISPQWDKQYEKQSDYSVPPNFSIYSLGK